MRTCGKCSVCCYAPELPELSKPHWKSCQYRCVNGTIGGCAIYKKRPAPCRSFTCLWLDNEAVPGEMRPDRCGLLVVGRPGNLIQVWEVGGTFRGSFWERLLEAYDFEIEVIQHGSRTVGDHDRR